MAKFCENCGAPLADGVAFCPECGTPVAQQPAPAPQNRCVNCGAALAPGEMFCAECGTPAGQQPAQNRCANCGAVLAPGEMFCAECGTPAGHPQQPAPAPQQPAYAQPVYAQPPVQQPYPQQPVQQQKKGKGLLIGLLCGGAALLIALVLVGGFVWPGFFKSGETPAPTGEESVYTPTKKPTEPKPTEPPFTEPTEPMPTETEPPETTEFVNPFTDMAEDDYAYDAFVWAYQNGIVSGGEAKPDKEIKRAEAVTFLWRAAGEPEPDLVQNPFTDVDESKYYYKAALWAYEMGIVTTSSKAEFKPTGDLSQAQALTFLNRLVQGGDSSGKRYFADVPPEKWYFAPIGWGVENGIVDYYGWSFGPDDSTWRGDFILWLARAMGADVEEAYYEGPSPNGFAENGVEINLNTENSVIFHSTRSKEDFTQTNLQASVVSYDVFTEADGYPTPEPGYEYRRLCLRVDGVDDTSKHGNYVIWTFSDYYYPNLRSQTLEEDDNGVFTSLVYYNGDFCPITYWQSNEINVSSGDAKGAIYAFTVLATVPQGYDGVVFGLQSAEILGTNIVFADEETIRDKYVAFRMD